MTVSNIVKPMDLRLVGEKSGTNRVYRSVSPSLIVEAALFVEIIEELGVRLRPPEVQVSDLEV